MTIHLEDLESGAQSVQPGKKDVGGCGLSLTAMVFLLIVVTPTTIVLAGTELREQVAIGSLSVLPKPCS